ncbi:MAG: T9SS type A sorting domain-containing protein, partial [Bacteroidota bacterium]
GKPTNSGENVVAGGYDFGQPIVVTWTDNPNPAVNQFQIWRKVKQDGDIPTLLATVGRGIQTYTDDTYIATNGYTNDLVQYDVRAYYSTEGTYSDPAWTAVFGKKNIYNIYEDKPIVSLSNELPTEYSISNYPNPFNPSTTINYQLPQDGMVTIKVYDMLGCEVATLVNENKPAGYYKVNFDASKLTSGVYIYTIRATAQAGQANNYVQSKKMLLMK